MLKTIEAKLYLTDAQERTLSDWLRICCWTYNRALEHRTKAYKRRNEQTTLFTQMKMLTSWRRSMARMKAVPCQALRDALRRVDRGMQGFFRRIKSGKKPGFPRFKSHVRYNSMEFLASERYVRSANLLRIPKLGLVRFRAGNRTIPAEQKLLRIIRRASGWYAQVLVEIVSPVRGNHGPPVGIDVGLETFATLSNNQRIENPRWLRRSERKLRALQRRLSRRRKGSRRRKKAVIAIQRQHERVAAQRGNFCHQHSRRIVNQYSLIAVEKLNIKGMVRSRLAKSILDAAWGTFTNQLRYKAEEAGSKFVSVNPRNTSRECPVCGTIKPKKLSEREHRCACGYATSRDHAAAQVILARALGVAEAKRSSRNPSSDAGGDRHCQVGPTKREVLNLDTTYPMAGLR